MTVEMQTKKSKAAAHVQSYIHVVSFPDPTHYAEKGLVTFEGCAESVIMSFLTNQIVVYST